MVLGIPRYSSASEMFAHTNVPSCQCVRRLWLHEANPLYGKWNTTLPVSTVSYTVTWYFHLRCGSTGGSGCYMYIIRKPVYCVIAYICIASVPKERSMEWVWNKILSIYGMFSLTQLVEKRLEKQGHMALAFVNLEKAVGIVPRKMAMATLRWMGLSTRFKRGLS